MSLEGRSGRLIVTVLLLCFLAYFVTALSWIWGPVRSGNMVFSDFFAHWSYGRFAAAHPGVGIYDAAGMHAFQGELFAARRLKAPFAYPPPYIFAVLPLAFAEIWTAAVLWSVLSVVAFSLAVGLGRGWLAWLAAVCPATALCIVYGQNALLIAALLVGGLRLMLRFPSCAGVLFGLACMKPQLAFLVPLALVAGRQWRVLAAAAATGAVLVVVSSLWLGISAWPAWFDAAMAQGSLVATDVSPYRQVTVQASLAIMGLDRPVALAWQAGFAALSAFGVLLAWLRGPSEAAGAALLAGTLLATPYAFQYDLTLLAAAVFCLVGARRGLGWSEAMILLAALLLPAVLSITSRFFWTGPTTIAVLFALSVLRARRPLPG